MFVHGNPTSVSWFVKAIIRDRGNGCDFHQKVWSDQPGDLNENAEGAVRQLKAFGPDLLDGRHVCRIEVENGQRHDVVQAPADCLQDAFDIVEALPGLRFTVVFPDDIPIMIPNDLPRHMKNAAFRFDHAMMEGAAKLRPSGRGIASDRHQTLFLFVEGIWADRPAFFKR